MGRTPLIRDLQDAVARVAAEEVGARPTTRRELLRRAGIAGLGLTALGRLAPVARAAGSARIAIVGAGLAGLTCAYRLKQQGYVATVYEASNRVGGRCWTGRGDFADSQVYEHGGELIDSGHIQLKHLTQELGLDLDNLLQAELTGTEMRGYFDGQPYTFAQMSDDLKTIWQQLHKDVSAASYPTLYNLSTPRGRELDQLSIIDWIQLYVPGGIASKLGQLLDVAYTIEYGAESSDQSSLNLLYLLGYSGHGQLRIFGPSNEKYHVRGGNDQIPARLAAALPGQISRAQELTAVKQNANGSFTLTFKSGPKSQDVTADKVVLALPFSILRNSVDYSRAGFRPLKKTAIEQQGMGTNSKLQLQFVTRHWESLGSNGETYADTGYQNTWEVSRGQPGSAGILVDYTGGNIGASFGSGTLAERAQQFLAQLEPVLPGISARWNGKAALDFWTGYKWTRGSYSFWKVGQYTQFAGIERETEGNCYFAGEHTSVDFQGYLNGAVDSGQQAASNILTAL